MVPGDAGFGTTRRVRELRAHMGAGGAGPWAAGRGRGCSGQRAAGNGQRATGNGRAAMMAGGVAGGVAGMLTTSRDAFARDLDM